MLAPRAHIVRCVVLVVAVYLAARHFGWVGPDAHVKVDPAIATPAIVVVTAWGLFRIATRLKEVRP